VVTTWIFDPTPILKSGYSLNDPTSKAILGSTSTQWRSGSQVPFTADPSAAFEPLQPKSDWEIGSSTQMG